MHHAIRSENASFSENYNDPYQHETVIHMEDGDNDILVSGSFHGEAPVAIITEGRKNTLTFTLDFLAHNSAVSLGAVLRGEAQLMAINFVNEHCSIAQLRFDPKRIDQIRVRDNTGNLLFYHMVDPFKGNWEWKTDVLRQLNKLLQKAQAMA
jgi:hypothetical protein